MFTLLITVLEQGLRFAAAKEGNKHQELLNKVLKVKKEYYEELRRTDYSQRILDELLLELQLHAETFGKIPAPKSK
jgi:hypothetical protein